MAKVFKISDLYKTLSSGVLNNMDNKKIVILAGVGLFILVGIGIGLGMLISGGDEEPKDENVITVEVPKTPDDGKVRAKATNEDGEEVDVVIGHSEEGVDEEEDDFFLDPIVIDIGELMVPVRTHNSLMYVVATIGIGLKDPRKAEFLRNDIIAGRVKNDILETMLKMAEYNLFSGDKVDTDYVSYALQKKISEKHEFIDEILFLSFIRQDIGG